MRPVLAMAKAAWLYNIRQPATLLFGFVMPIGIIVVFYLIGNGLFGAANISSQIVPGVLTYSVVNASLSSSGMTLVAWRSSGLLARLRLQPISAWEVAVARFIVSVIITLLQAIVFVGLGMIFLDLRVNWMFALLVAPTIILGGLVFFFFGGCAGMLANSQESVSSGLSLILLPLGLLSGCFIPLSALPGSLARIMELTPLTAMTQLLVGSAAGGADRLGVAPWAVLIVSCIVAALLFIFMYRRKAS